MAWPPPPVVADPVASLTVWGSEAVLLDQRISPGAASSSASGPSGLDGSVSNGGTGIAFACAALSGAGGGPSSRGSGPGAPDADVGSSVPITVSTAMACWESRLLLPD